MRLYIYKLSNESKQGNQMKRLIVQFIAIL